MYDNRVREGIKLWDSDSRPRPKAKIPRTKSEWVWDVIGYSIFLGSVLFLIIMWSSLPAQVPGHYNAAGEVDRWGSKFELLILPLVGGFSVVVVQVLELMPEAHNYPKRLNESNVEQFYVTSRKLLNQVKNVCLIFFGVLQIQTIFVALNYISGLGKWFLPALIIAMSVPIVITILKFRKIK